MEKHLPSEIIFDIFARLPVDSIVQLQDVCKSWRALLNDPSFINLYIGPPLPGFLFLLNSNTTKEPKKRFQFGDEYDDDDKVTYLDVSKLSTQYHFNKPDAIGSCNGFVCLYSSYISVDKIYICNPFTREYVNLPNLKLPTRVINGEERNFYVASGFGCHPVTNEYKVVRIYLHKKEEQLRQVQVYTLGSGKWRSITETPLSLCSINSKGVLSNGAIHWMNANLEIISFDLADEEFITVPSSPPLRPYFRGNDKKFHQLGIFGESLCVIEQNFSVERSEIWVRNKNEDDACIWTKKFSIPWKGMFSVYKLLSLSRHGGKLLMQNAWKPALISYDVKTKGLTETECFPASGWFDIIPYKKSFVSLKALGEPAKIMSE